MSVDWRIMKASLLPNESFVFTNGPNEGKLDYIVLPGRIWMLLGTLPYELTFHQSLCTVPLKVNGSEPTKLLNAKGHFLQE